MSPVILDPFRPLLATHIVPVGDEVEESTSQEAFPIGATLDQLYQPTPPSDAETIFSDAFNQLHQFE